jgi:hypothetical protein
MSSPTVTTIPNGIQVPIGDLVQTFTYSGSLIATITVAYQGKTFIQTYANNGTQVTSISQWTQQ